MISHKLRTIFIHVTKTAGSSIEVAMDAVEQRNKGTTDPATGEHVNVVTGDEKHLSAKACKILVGEDTWNEYFKFTVVRNPWDRFHSLWWNGRNVGNRHDLELPEYSEYFLERSLNGKLRGLLQGRLRIHQRFWPQVEFLRSANGRVEMDKICRFESIDADFAEVADRIGLPSRDLPKILMKNRQPSSRRFYADDYDEKTRALVADVYRDDIQEFGYRFGD
jgi:hypothetical protein